MGPFLQSCPTRPSMNPLHPSSEGAHFFAEVPGCKMELRSKGGEQRRLCWPSSGDWDCPIARRSLFKCPGPVEERGFASLEWVVVGKSEQVPDWGLSLLHTRFYLPALAFGHVGRARASTRNRSALFACYGTAWSPEQLAEQRWQRPLGGFHLPMHSSLPIAPPLVSLQAAFGSS